MISLVAPNEEGDQGWNHSMWNMMITRENGTPTGWYSKKQVAMKTENYGSETYGSEFVDLDLCTTLRYLGVPVKSKSNMFGDNNSVVTSSTLPHSGLNKHHNALSYHSVYEAIAAEIFGFLHIDEIQQNAVMVLLPRSPSPSRIKFLDHLCTCAWQRGVAQSEKT